MKENDTSDTATQSSGETTRSTAVDDLTGFAALSRKIRSRTTDLLAVAIVLVGGVSIGTQLSRWWATDDANLTPAPTADTNVSWGDGETPVTLEFGDHPIQLQRQTVRGDRHAALSRLVEICAGIAKISTSMTTSIQPAEQKLLGLLQRQSPVREQRGVWQVYRIERPMTLVVATRTMKRPLESSGNGNDVSDLASQPDQANRRVVCWGMAQPSREGLWVLFTMRPTVLTAEPRLESGQVELPAGARKILSLRDAAGGALTAFEGEAAAEDWKSWFDDWFARRGWRTSQHWVESPIGWSAAFVPAEEGVSGRIDVSFSPVGESRLGGMISVTTPVGVVQKGVSKEGFDR